MSALVVTPLAARRFLRRMHGFNTPFPTVARVLTHHGYIQIDPINVCGRMHDLILRNRVRGYREGDLMRHLHGDAAPWPTAARTAFEHYLPQARVLVAFPLEAWPHLQPAMQAWSRSAGLWSGRLTPREKILATELLATIAARGPLGSEDFDDARTTRPLWGSSRLVKITLEKLFFHGRLLIATRNHHRRRYDLPERVLPASVIAQPKPTPEETARWLVRLKLRQRRLVTLTREAAHCLADEIQPVAVEGCPPLFCLRADVPLLEQAAAESADPAKTSASPIALLAPLDPMIYDRRLTSALWGFDYTWEAYTPPAKRVRGYYALPILAGTEIVGHVDPKADRKTKKLGVMSRRVRRGHSLASSLREFAGWLGLK